MLEAISRFIKSQRGSIESSLALIPLLTLFLISTQIVIAVQGRNMEKLNAQDSASRSALTGQFSASDSFIHIHSPDPNQNLDMVISHRRRGVIQVFPGLSTLMGREPMTAVSGIAIVENQR